MLGVNVETYMDDWKNVKSVKKKVYKDKYGSEITESEVKFLKSI